MQDDNKTPPDANQASEEIYQDLPPGERKTPKYTFFSFSNVASVVLLIGMIILYILFFTVEKPSGPQAQIALQKSGAGSLSVAFVNIDSLNEKYEFVRALKNDLESTGRRLQTEVMTEQGSLEKEIADFQRQVGNNTITEEKAKMVYEELMQKQQSLLEKKDRYTQQVANQELSLNLRLLDTVTNFLRRYNKSFGFDYILTYKTGGDILIANDTLDITKDVVKMLNEEYKESKK